MNRSTPKGLTLVELLIAVVLMTVVSSLALYAFQTAIRARDVSDDRIDVYEKARSAMDLIAKDLQTAYLSDRSVASRFKPWIEDDTNPLPRFVCVNRTFTTPAAPYTIGDPNTETAYINRNFVDEYPRDLLSFASVKDSPGSTDDLTQIVYTCVRDWNTADTAKTKRMTLVRGFKTTTKDGTPAFVTPVKDVNDDSGLTWEAVCENVWGIDFQFFAFDYSKTETDYYAGWTVRNETPYIGNETPHINRKWNEAMVEWHSAAESCCFAMWLDDPDYLSGEMGDGYGFVSFSGDDRQQPVINDSATGSYYPQFLFLSGGDYGSFYYRTEPPGETFFLSNELEDADFSTDWRRYKKGGNDAAPIQDIFDKMVETRDGLPRMVQITLWIQPGDSPRVRHYPDGKEHPDDRALPIKVQTRVSLTAGGGEGENLR